MRIYTCYDIYTTQFFKMRVTFALRDGNLSENEQI